MKLIKRLEKGSALTALEHDSNLVNIEKAIYSLAEIKTKIIEFENNNVHEKIINLGLDTSHQITAISIVNERPVQLFYSIDVFLEAVDSGENKIIRLKKAEIELQSVFEGTPPLFSKVGFTGSLKIATASPDIADIHPVNYSGIGDLDIVSLPTSEFESSGRVVFKNLIPFNVDNLEQKFMGQFSYAGMPWIGITNKIKGQFNSVFEELPRIININGGVQGDIKFNELTGSYQVPVFCPPQTKGRVVVSYINKNIR